MIVNTRRCQLTQRPTVVVLTPQCLQDELLLKWICDAALKASRNQIGFTITVRSHDAEEEFEWICGDEDLDSGDGLEIGQ